MQCNSNSFIQKINFHGLFRNALWCRKTAACRILVPFRYMILFSLGLGGGGGGVVIGLLDRCIFIIKDQTLIAFNLVFY